MKIPTPWGYVDPTGFHETEIRFPVAGLPFIFSAWGGLFLNDFKASVHLQSGMAPVVAQISGISHLQPIRINKNDLDLPEPFLKDVFCMCKNRVLIQAFTDRGDDPTEKKWDGESMWHWFTFDEKNARQKWNEIKTEVMKKVAALG